MFNLGGFVKSLFSSIVSRINGIREVYNRKIDYKTSLTGFMECRKTINGTVLTVTQKCYCRGEPILREITPYNLQPESYLITATTVTLGIANIEIYELVVERGLIKLVEFNLGDSEISEDLAEAIGEMYNDAMYKNNCDENNRFMIVYDDDYYRQHHGDNDSCYDDDDSCYDDDDSCYDDD
jgi:hypothetical protein